MPTLPALSYVCTGLVTVGIAVGGYGGPAFIIGTGTLFDNELTIGQLVSWTGADGATHSRTVTFIYGGVLELDSPTFGAEQVTGVPLTAYYNADVYVPFAMMAADCKVLNLWLGSDRNASGPSDASSHHWYDTEFDDTKWAPAAAVTPDPAWTEGLPLLTPSDYIWDEQQDNPVDPEGSNAGEQMLIRWRFTVPNTTWMPGPTNLVSIATGSHDEPHRSPVCDLGDTPFVRMGGVQLYLNGTLFFSDSPLAGTAVDPIAPPPPPPDPIPLFAGVNFTLGALSNSPTATITVPDDMWNTWPVRADNGKRIAYVDLSFDHLVESLFGTTMFLQMFSSDHDFQNFPLNFAQNGNGTGPGAGIVYIDTTSRELSFLIYNADVNVNSITNLVLTLVPAPPLTGTFAPVDSGWWELLRPGANLLAIKVNDASYLGELGCPGSDKWQPWISVPWFALGLILHSYSLDIAHAITLSLNASIAESAGAAISHARAFIIG